MYEQPGFSNETRLFDIIYIHIYIVQFDGDSNSVKLS